MRSKEVQGRLWSTAPDGWVKYLEPTFIPMYQDVLNSLSLDPDKMLLDAGCGSGLFLSMAAATGAEIQGIDAAPGLLSISKQRLPGIPLQLEDLEALPFIDGSFDIVTGFNSFQYAGSFENALAEAARVVKRHGKVVIGIWDKAELCEAAAVLNAVGKLVPLAVRDLNDVFSMSEDGNMEAICQSVGLKVLTKEKVFCPWQFNSQQSLLDAFLSTAPCVKAAELVGREAVIEAILDHADIFQLADEVYYMRNQFIYFIAEKVN